MNERVVAALRVYGVDLASVENAKDKRPIPAEAVRGAIKDMAQDVLALAALHIGAKVAKNENVLGMTEEAICTLKLFDEEIVRNEKAAKTILESVRSLKSAMTLEMQYLDKAVKQIKDMNLEKTINDLDRLRTLAESATIKKLFGA